MALQFKIRAAILCDDARQENNKKRMFIGVYNPQIFVRSFPASIRVYIVLVIDIENPGKGPVNLRLVSDEPGHTVQIDGSLEGKDTIFGEIFAVGPLTVQANKPTEVRLECQFGDDWKSVQSWTVANMAQVPTP